MNVYEKSMKTLRSSKTLSSFLNSFVEIQFESQDENHKKLLSKAIDFLRRAIAHPKSPKISVILDLNVPIYKSINEYCEKAVLSNKPDWQVSAEMNGWIKKGVKDVK